MFIKLDHNAKIITKQFTNVYHNRQIEVRDNQDTENLEELKRVKKKVAEIEKLVNDLFKKD